MHPLESIPDEGNNKKKAASHVQSAEMRRRTSLDNSILGNGTVEFLIPESLRMKQARRFSLDPDNQRPTLFMAGQRSQEKRKDIDIDLHASIHSMSVAESLERRKSLKEVPENQQVEDENAASAGDDEDESEVVSGTRNLTLSGDDAMDETSLPSEGDSFCEASVLEPPNRSYIKEDLGASFEMLEFDLDDEGAAKEGEAGADPMVAEDEEAEREVGDVEKQIKDAKERQLGQREEESAKPPATERS